MRFRKSRELHRSVLLKAAKIAGIAIVLLVAAAGSVRAVCAADTLAAPTDLNTVIDNLRNWLVGLLVGLATLALTIGGVRYLLAGGDPSEVGKAKETLKYAAIGYGVAVLAPGLVEVLKGIVGA